MITLGDEIIFSQKENSSKIIKIKVVALYRYSSFEKLFSDFPSNDFGGDDKESLLLEVHQFYSHKEEEKMVLFV